MPATYKILGLQAPGAGALTTLYTAPAATQTVVSTIVVCNRASTATSFRVSVAISGAADNPNQYLFYDTSIAGNQTISLTAGITLGAGDVVRVQNAAAQLTFSAFGVENT